MESNLAILTNECIKHDQVVMSCARNYATLSFAVRLKVGAVLIHKNTKMMLCFGVNHMPKGFPNVCEEEVDCVCMTICPDDEENRKHCPYCKGSKKVLQTLPNLIHAEVDCIDNAKKMGIRLKDTIMFVTHSPCLACADYIDKHGIKTVVYGEEYRITDGIDYLKENNVVVRKL